MLKQPGSIDGLKIGNNLAIPKLNVGEVRIEVKAVGLSPSDYQTMEFLDIVDPNQVTILGLDVAGIVDEVGEEV